MASKRMRLDRLLSQKTSFNRSDIRVLVAQKRILVDKQPAQSVDQLVNDFSHIVLDGQLLQAKERQYVMMYKPVGVVSATVDQHHKTVLDLLAANNPELLVDDLHIVGRLDLNSSGLLLLTNDGAWSSKQMLAAEKVVKKYQVTVEKPITSACVQAFADGMYFEYEDITTAAAELIVGANMTSAQVHLVEGRYHQIKRMFGRFRNPVLSIHRFQIGDILLDETLLPGFSRHLSPVEIGDFSLGL